MFSRIVVILACADVLLGVWLNPHRHQPTAGATGTGPSIALGTPSGASVAVNASTAAPDPYKGFNIHLAATPSAGVTLTGIAGSSTGSTLDTGNPADLYCTTQIPTANQVNYGCVPLAGQSSSAAGLLARMTLQATGNGCITVQLIDLLPGDPTAVVSDTYTVDKLTTTLQQNTITTTTKQVLIGAGTLANCVAAPPSVGGIATAPDLANVVRPRPRGGVRDAAIALAVLIVFGAAAWNLRRSRM